MVVLGLSISFHGIPASIHVGLPLINIQMKRICIYSKDICWITGRSERYAREVMRDIRLLLQKEKHQLITIAEACDYLGLPFQEVYDLLNGKR